MCVKHVGWKRTRSLYFIAGSSSGPERPCKEGALVAGNDREARTAGSFQTVVFVVAVAVVVAVVGADSLQGALGID